MEQGGGESFAANDHLDDDFKVKTEKAVKDGPCFTQLEGRVWRGNEEVGEKRHFRKTCERKMMPEQTVEANK